MTILLHANSLSAMLPQHILTMPAFIGANRKLADNQMWERIEKRFDAVEIHTLYDIGTRLSVYTAQSIRRQEISNQSSFLMIGFG